MTKRTPNPPKFGRMKLGRLTGKQTFGLLCVACTEEDNISPMELYEIELGEYGYYICPEHYTGFLALMLRNWLRRVDRGKPVPAIPKDVPEEELTPDQALVNDLEEAITAQNLID